MNDVRALIDRLAAQEARLRAAALVAPCVPGGAVRTRLDGLVYTFRPEPAGFEGWGRFRPRDAVTADVLGEATPAQIAAWQRLFPAVRLRLAFRLRGRSWLAFPANAFDERQRIGDGRPAPVHLAERVAAFDAVVARFDGAAFWFEALDRRADPRQAEALRSALRAETPPEVLRLAGLTPEDRMAYAIAFRRTTAGRTRRRYRRDADRLGAALDFAGGTLQSFEDRGDCWLVDWALPSGEAHRTAIRKDDLTVLSAGICLDDRDEDFDLQSLVSVVEQNPF